MKCHIVPQVYLKKWEIVGEPNHIYAFNSDSLKDVGQKKEIEDICFLPDEYIFSPYNVVESNKFSDEYNKIFGFLIDDYICTYNGKEIEDTYQYALLFNKIFDWKIVKSSQAVSNLEIKNRILANWDKCFSMIFEIYINTSIENKWNGFLISINNYVTKKKGAISKTKSKYLMEVVATQILRIRSNYKDLQEFNKLDDKIRIVKEVLGVNELVNMDEYYSKDDIVKQLWFYTLYDYSKKRNNFITRYYKYLLNRTICILYSKVNCFITSDNPCFFNSNNDSRDFASGIFYPITPKICLFLAGNQSTKKIVKIHITDKISKFINHLIVCNSDNIVLVYEDKIVDKIIESSSINYKDIKEEWDRLFFEKGLVINRSNS
ncbi:DUF4238 domain-containing protein [Clostridium sp. 'deep sea']|uniref:DUF4238 domain-containing protein n=1 Tax=Clostridium sp. 'deep sea' TaxID=2779445 RepID=UPI0018964A9F|nr:DUF4238 domain-containing protein [Clostridium sp. 'deep sea']QOR33862.1 DUF4238 domain-containing protein [Clostridium sp. 'deep sea']